jgi:hypothetical protein
MKKNYLLSAGLPALCVCITLGVLALLPPRPGITKANFDRIEVGMTVAEVDKLLGPPSTQGLRQEPLNWRPLPLQDAKRCIVWGDEEGLAWIGFDTDGQVVSLTWDDFGQTYRQRFLRLLPF